MEINKRVFPRIDVDITVKQVGNAVNISEGGIRIISENPIPVGSKVDLDLLLSNTSGSVEHRLSDTVRYQGIVMWVKYSELFDKHEIGIRFTSLHTSDKNKIRSFVESYS